MGARLVSLLCGSVGPRFGLGSLTARAGRLFVCRGTLHLRIQAAGLGFIAVLTCDLTAIFEFPIAPSSESRRKRRDQNQSANYDQNDCDRAHWTTRIRTISAATRIAEIAVTDIR
jgi:hypothetical protein